MGGRNVYGGKEVANRVFSFFLWNSEGTYIVEKWSGVIGGEGIKELEYYHVQLNLSVQLT
jgi:hypothetical protein